MATHADNCGRRKLAAMLVEHEPRSTKQVCLSNIIKSHPARILNVKVNRHSLFLVSHVLWSLSVTSGSSFTKHW